MPKFIHYTEQQKEGIRKHFEEEILNTVKDDPTYDGAQLYKYIIYHYIYKIVINTTSLVSI